jgi:hypothetical protein
MKNLFMEKDNMKAKELNKLLDPLAKIKNDGNMYKSWLFDKLDIKSVPINQGIRYIYLNKFTNQITLVSLKDKVKHTFDLEIFELEEVLVK